MLCVTGVYLSDTTNTIIKKKQTKHSATEYVLSEQ